MTATNELTGTTDRSRRRHSRRHEDAVIQAEVRRLARALGGAVEGTRTIRRPAGLRAYREAAARVLGDRSA